MSVVPGQRSTAGDHEPAAPAPCPCLPSHARGESTQCGDVLGGQHVIGRRFSEAGYGHPAVRVCPHHSLHLFTVVHVMWVNFWDISLGSSRWSGEGSVTRVRLLDLCLIRPQAHPGDPLAARLGEPLLESPPGLRPRACASATAYTVDSCARSRPRGCWSARSARRPASRLVRALRRTTRSRRLRIWLRAASEHQALALAGHTPFLDRLASLLVAGDEDAQVVQFRMVAWSSWNRSRTGTGS